ncbi:Aminoglycoside phosphotransferase protein [Rutstroemia sp. NJR-2017a BVV2]|nr:Aminoglycoside phosphotransferase protein [Rutstroemia sp. NJR-2017a BVV2]
MASSNTAVPGKASKTSLMYSVPVRRLKEILSHVVPDLTLGSVEELSSTQLPRLYTLNMSDDNKLLLSFAPSLAVRLLRHETSLQYSEATLVHFLETSMSSRKEGSMCLESRQQDSLHLNLKDVVPKMLKHSSNNREMAYPYTIFEQTPGKTLSNLSIYLSIPERQLIDKQIGSLTRSLASLTSPTGTFGTAARVLPDPFKQSSPSASVPRGEGSPTWTEAFNDLLESILRDGEDMAVLLPYDVVRAHYQRLSWRLDAVTLPRLVLLDLGEKNILIENGDPTTTSSPSRSSSTRTQPPKVTGLRSWSQGVFGDPLLSSVFENPSASFLEGWNSSADSEPLIEDPANADVRLLLYRCYRAVVGIVTEYYRPQPDSSRRELENRRNLTSALADLEKVDVAVNDALKRARSMSISVDRERAKRVKTSSTGGGGRTSSNIDDDEKMKLTSVLNM